MTEAEFRALALGLPGVVEHAEQDHPDFRVGGKVFALLGRPETTWATLLLSAEDQPDIVAACPEAFRPAPGGAPGHTQVHLSEAPHPRVREALIAAWRDKAPRRIRDHFRE
ncbi:MmcQ/YjbR family DNA-binding protein [Halomonas campisalis]|uniref:MmcQ/YjbR family DNA-binding protein n=1 Tax=Billgrantia campisalis TaxID=74661 RepID=A0ABS9P8A5_9GAMM|nr:MmcQ/YjbR family DNA-binding protein [Halomonas campisalis]MCG6658006.1 MmcQ/YjbR family DNA-binding protein [Halomonas campisalis]MDR5864840.1 MmcQ/YjbR family DNA-binding protein [Halomonas campisalis]